MIVLDTNVVSELLRPVPEPRVEAWLAAQNGPDVCLTAVSEAELCRGVCMLSAGRRRAALADAIEAILKQDFAGRVLRLDSAAAKAFAAIFVDRRNAGRPTSDLRAAEASPALLPDRRHRHPQCQGFRRLRDLVDRSVERLIMSNGKTPKKNGNGANLGLEAQLWATADKLRSNMEPSEYRKHKQPVEVALSV